MRYRNSTAHYAEKYAVSERTVRRWKESNYPLDDPAAMAEKVAKQKNLPSSFHGGKSPGTRGLPPRVYNALVMAQWMQVRVNRWGRKLEASMLEADSQPGDRKELVSFVRSLVRREIQCGVQDLIKAFSGQTLGAIKADRRAEDQAYHQEDEE